MKLGLVTYNLASEWDLGAIEKNCSETGFEGVELRTGHAHGIELDLGIKEGMIYTVFVDPESELVEHFSDWADHRMIARLEKLDLESMKIRERITIAVRMRLEGLSGHEEALRRSIFNSFNKTS